MGGKRPRSLHNRGGFPRQCRDVVRPDRGAAVAVALALACVTGCVTLDPTTAERTQWREDRAIAFSTDDRAITYRHNGTVYVARAGGDEHRPVFTAPESTVVSSPLWAPGRRGLAFLTTSGLPTDSVGPQPCDVWFWPAPEEIWESSGGSGTDTVTLPEEWEPAPSRKIVRLACLHPMQIQAAALCAWHPDGRRLLCADSARGGGRQRLVAVDVATGMTTSVCPLEARSFAFRLSPDGLWLVCAVDDTAEEEAGLWLGPLSAEVDAWRRLDACPGPVLVPRLKLDGAPPGQGAILRDLRPRLGSWSPDSGRLAYFRVEDDAPSATTDSPPGTGRQPDTHTLVVISLVSPKEASQRVPLPRGFPSDLHWSPDGLRLGYMLETELSLMDAATGMVTPIAGLVEVKRFLGWSADGEGLSYVTPQTPFRTTWMPLPGQVRVTWGPAERHHLIVAEGAGTRPRSRFEGMNIASAQWGEAGPKISLWATYLPTVNLLPSGDPAAVLDLEEDAVRWFPTNVEEYAQVGHYYLLNDRYGEALTRYAEALGELGDGEAEASLRAQLRLWSGICELARGRLRQAGRHLDGFRTEFPFDEPDAAEEAEPTALPPGVARSLHADRVLLSTMLSMNQTALAERTAARLGSRQDGARRLQAHCFLALLEASVGSSDHFLDRLARRILPQALDPGVLPPAAGDALVTESLDTLRDPLLVRRTEPRALRTTARRLERLARRHGPSRRESARRMAAAAALLYRELGDPEAELATRRAGQVAE